MIGSRDVQMQRRKIWRRHLPIYAVAITRSWISFPLAGQVSANFTFFYSQILFPIRQTTGTWGMSANLVRKAHNLGCLLDELVTTNKHNCGDQIAPYLSISYQVSGWDKHHNDLNIRIYNYIYNYIYMHMFKSSFFHFFPLKLVVLE